MTDAISSHPRQQPSARAGRHPSPSGASSSDYAAFLTSKRQAAPATGITVDAGAIHSRLFDFQRDIVLWALRRGRAAIFADTGLGKTAMQLEWARHIAAHTGGKVLILAPLAVSQQTVREGAKFGVIVHPCRAQADVQDGLNITNYEMLQHFDSAAFAGVVLDESSLLKSYMGATKRALVEAFAATTYRLACTATPAPNDHMEMGNHAEFLGVMPSSEMLMRWFINDTMEMGHYRLKGHAVRDFWDWVASWAVSLRRPSDLGYLDDGFVLPPLHLRQDIVAVDRTVDRGDRLFRDPTMSATTLHREMRLTAPDRAAHIAEMVNGSNEVYAVWCHTNYEADELMARIPDAIEVRGSESIAAKERKLVDFSEGRARVIVTKAEIAGFGLNWQHCHHTAFMGLSYSFEQFYQAVRRFYRFGQQHPVEAVVVAAETEGPVLAAIERKMAAHEQMRANMQMSASRLALHEDLQLATYAPAEPMRLPEWLFSRDVAAGAAASERAC